MMVGFTVHQSGKNVSTVQTGKVQHQDLSTVVSASGEIKPKTYANIGANAFGKITHLYVKEGDHVKKGPIAGATGKRAVVGGRECQRSFIAGGADGCDWRPMPA